MTEAEGRAAVCAEAVTWLRTPWHHRGQVKGVGVDCAMLPLGVYAAAGMIPAFDPGEYPRDWHIHMRHERYIPIVERIAVEIDPSEVRPADLLIFKIGLVYSHGVIVLDWPQGIHAAIKEGMVTLCDIEQDQGLAPYDRRAFTLKRWP